MSLCIVNYYWIVNKAKDFTLSNYMWQWSAIEPLNQECNHIQYSDFVLNAGEQSHVALPGGPQSAAGLQKPNIKLDQSKTAVGEKTRYVASICASTVAVTLSCRYKKESGDQLLCITSRVELTTSSVYMTCQDVGRTFPCTCHLLYSVSHCWSPPQSTLQSSAITRSSLLVHLMSPRCRWYVAPGGRQCVGRLVHGQEPHGPWQRPTWVQWHRLCHGRGVSPCCSHLLPAQPLWSSTDRPTTILWLVHHCGLFGLRFVRNLPPSTCSPSMTLPGA